MKKVLAVLGLVLAIGFTAEAAKQSPSPTQISRADALAATIQSFLTQPLRSRESDHLRLKKLKAELIPSSTAACSTYFLPDVGVSDGNHYWGVVDRYIPSVISCYISTTEPWDFWAVPVSPGEQITFAIESNVRAYLSIEHGSVFSGSSSLQPNGKYLTGYVWTVPPSFTKATAEIAVSPYATSASYTLAVAKPSGSAPPTATPGRGRDTPTPGPPAATPTPTPTTSPSPPALGAGASTTNGWFAFVGHIAGVGQSLFRTDLWLFNADPTNSTIATLILHTQAGADISKAVSIGPKETKFFPDVTQATLFAGDGQVGSLEWQSGSPLMGGISVYTDGGSGGTFGFSVPAIPLGASMKPKLAASDTTNVLQLFAINSGNPGFRVNLDITNTSSVPIPVEVRVYDPFTGVVYGGTRFYSIAPKSLLRAGRILEVAGAPLMDGLRITVAITEGTVLGPGGGGIIAVATTLDNRSNDGVAFVGQAR